MSFITIGIVVVYKYVLWLFSTPFGIQKPRQLEPLLEFIFKGIIIYGVK